MAAVAALAATSNATAPIEADGPIGSALTDLTPFDVEMAFPDLSFSQMVHIADAADSTGRLWVVQQNGQVLVFINEPSASSTNIFLDIGTQLSATGGEQGLLGLAFDPSYFSNGYFYVNYTAPTPLRSVISRFTVSSTDANLANPNSELVLLEVEQPFGNHNGGMLAFGPDGYLYASLGDGGSSGDPGGHGQNRTTLLGSVLRIDVSAATQAQPYSVPADNPFVGAGGGVREELWAYGLRNPWRFSFDPPTGQLWVGDVGQNHYEEVDILEPGRNYGWNVMEGAHCYPPPGAVCDQTDLELPVAEYAHSEGCSITGGRVYRGTRVSDLAGAYVYGDYCSGKIWGLRYEAGSVIEQALLIDTNLTITSFGVDQQGTLYIIPYNGAIHRFVARPVAVPVPAATELLLVVLAASLGATSVLVQPMIRRRRQLRLTGLRTELPSHLAS